MDKVLTHVMGNGAVFAAIISWSMWESFWWMFLHSILSWFYIIYWTIKY